MLILRKLFSKKKEGNKKEKYKDDDYYLKTDKSTVIGGIGTFGGLAGNKILSRSVLKDDTQKEGTRESRAIYDRLKNDAERRGIKVDDRLIIDKSGASYIPGSDTVLMNTDKKVPNTLAHELGHRHYMKEGAKTVGDKIGKALHKYYKYSGGKYNIGLIAPFTAAALGEHSGRTKWKKEQKGEKESAWNRHKAWVVPAAMTLPIIAAEGMASRHGIKLMKSTGQASKEAIKDAKKKLNKALGTYITSGLASVGVGELSRGLQYEQKKLNTLAKKREEEEANKKKETGKRNDNKA